MIVEKNGSYLDFGRVIRRGEVLPWSNYRDRHWELGPPEKLYDALKALDGSFTIRIVLEPWPEGAIEDGAVTAYWPEPITLPDIPVTIRKEKAAEEE